jgi:hypothetical protein
VWRDSRGYRLRTPATDRDAFPARTFDLAVALGVGGFLLLVGLTTPVTERNGGFDSDGVFYAAMTGDSRFPPALAATPPWCWRPLTPLVVAALPFATLTGFQVVSTAATAGCLLLFYALLLRLGASRGAALLGLALYAGVFWAVKFSFYSPAYVDASTQLVLLLVLWLVARERYAIVVPVLAVGVLQKESLVALGLVAYAGRAARVGWRSREALGYLTLVLSLPLLAHLAVRALVPAAAPYSLTQVAGQAWAALRPSMWPRLVLEVYSGLGVLPLVLLYGWKDAARVAPREPAWLTLVAVGAALLFGGVDKGRLFLYLLPAVVVWIVALVAAIRRRSDERRFGGWLTATLVLHFYLGNYLTPIGAFPQYLARLVPIHSSGSAYASVLASRLVLSVLWLGFTVLILRRARS